MVRTSRCGRDNPGSTPGEDSFAEACPAFGCDRGRPFIPRQATNESAGEDAAKQQREGLFGEGHRWVDMRRHDRLNEIPTDRDGDVVHVQFPTPVLDVD